MLSKCGLHLERLFSLQKVRLEAQGGGTCHPGQNFPSFCISGVFPAFMSYFSATVQKAVAKRKEEGQKFCFVGRLLPLDFRIPPSTVTTVGRVGQLPRAENQQRCIWGQAEAPPPRPLTTQVHQEGMQVLQCITMQSFMSAPTTVQKREGRSFFFLAEGPRLCLQLLWYRSHLMAPTF